MTLFKTRRSYSFITAAVFCITTLSFSFSDSLFAVSLQEKRQNLQKGALEATSTDDFEAHLKELNQQIQEKKIELLKLNIEAESIVRNAPNSTTIEQSLAEKLPEIQKRRADLLLLENNWKELSRKLANNEDDALWHQPDTTIGQLVIDYGTVDHVYLMPPEIAGLKVHVSTQLTVPRAAWNEMLELILASYGIGTKQLNTYLRQLFFLRLNQSAPSCICENFTELSAQPLNARVLCILTPPPTEVRRIFQFLERFVPQEQVNFQMSGANIVMTGYVKELLELSKLYNFLLKPKQTEEYKLVALQKGQPQEIANILLQIFNGQSGNERAFNPSEQGDSKHLPFYTSDMTSGLRVIPMKQPASSLFLMGKPEQIEKASQIIQDIESRIGEVQEKTVYWYACRHSEAEELAKVLSNVYQKIVSTPMGKKDQTNIFEKEVDVKEVNKNDPNPEPQDASYEQLAVNPGLVTNAFSDSKKRSVSVHDNFIVDPKTNSIVMVVETYILDRLKALTKILDVPKKMVQIDILMVEKIVEDSNSFGMNILRLRDAASDKFKGGASWNNRQRNGDSLGKAHHRHSSRGHADGGAQGSGKGGKGIFNFFLSQKGHGFMPAFDVAFNFLLSQKDVRINANPTVTTINQTPTKVAFVDEISLNTGVIEFDTTGSNTHLKDSYIRAQYGITIQITPTIHAKVDSSDSEGEQKFITLATDINFDTPEKSRDDRPDVIRRSIKNEVRVADGETMILGGLRRKTASDDREAIPFLGELPGVGKFFSTSSMRDATTEMFIFITPRIVPDPADELAAMVKKELLKRPGDLPEFLKEVAAAKSEEKRELFEGTMKMLFGRSTAAG